MSIQQLHWVGLACSAGLAAPPAAVVPGTFRGPDARTDPGTQVAAGAEAEKAQPDPALERTREQVKMLDDLYKNARVNTDEWCEYSGLPEMGRSRATVCYAAGEWARADDGDGIREVHVNTLEGCGRACGTS